MRNSKYKYEIGSHENGKVILEQIRMKNGNSTCKGYRVMCEKDYHKWETTEYNLPKRGCPVCTNRICVTGINDVATTHPHLIEYFKHVEDAKTHTYSCTDLVDIICPKCGFVRNRKIDDLSRSGVECPNCRNNISIPERFMRNILDNLNIEYETEKQFEWSNLKRYDFYFKYNDKKTIIETHGSQHYYKTNRKGARTLQEEQNNDRLKRELALSNEIDEYIVIDCRRNNLDFIKNNIYLSPMRLLDGLDDLDFELCLYESYRPIVEEACKLWNEGIRKICTISQRR